MGASPPNWVSMLTATGDGEGIGAEVRGGKTILSTLCGLSISLLFSPY